MIAFVLSGEGAKGAYQLGVMSHLEKQGIKPDMIMGNSSGSAAAALYAHGGLEACKEFVFDTKNISDIFQFNWNFLWKQGIFNCSPLRNRLKRYLKGPPKIPYFVNTLDVKSSHLKRYHFAPNQVCSEAWELNKVCASVAIQFLVEPVIGEADAGARELLPISQAVAAGATEIYVLLASPPKYREQELPEGFLSFAKIGFNMINFLIDQNLVNDLINIDRMNRWPTKDVKVTVLGPPEVIGHQLEFRRAKEYFNRGEYEYMEYDLSKIYPDEER